jgi:hypothetical protein
VSGVEYELVVSHDGTAALTCGGEVMWTSDGDDAYLEEFGEELIDFEDNEQLDAIIDFLVRQGYVPPAVEVDIIDIEDSRDDL